MGGNHSYHSSSSMPHRPCRNSNHSVIFQLWMTDLFSTSHMHAIVRQNVPSRRNPLLLPVFPSPLNECTTDHLTGLNDHPNNDQTHNTLPLHVKLSKMNLRAIILYTCTKCRGDHGHACILYLYIIICQCHTYNYIYVYIIYV